MRRTILVVIATVAVLLSLLSFHARAQSGFNYQAVVRNSEGNPIRGQQVGLKISVVDSTGQNTYYVETHSPTTDQFGLVTMSIGKGSVESGSFVAIPWSAGGLKMRVELDANGGTSYAEMGTAAFNAVPYALFAYTGNRGEQGEQGTQGIQGI